MQTITRQAFGQGNLTSELRQQIRWEVYKVLEEIEYDSDQGLELQPAFVRKLKKRIASKEKGVPLETIMRKYGLKA